MFFIVVISIFFCSAQAGESKKMTEKQFPLNPLVQDDPLHKSYGKCPLLIIRDGVRVLHQKDKKI